MQNEAGHRKNWPYLLNSLKRKLPGKCGNCLGSTKWSRYTCIEENEKEHAVKKEIANSLPFKVKSHPSGNIFPMQISRKNNITMDGRGFERHQQTEIRAELLSVLLSQFSFQFPDLTKRNKIQFKSKNCDIAHHKRHFNLRHYSENRCCSLILPWSSGKIEFFQNKL